MEEVETFVVGELRCLITAPKPGGVASHFEALPPKSVGDDKCFVFENAHAGLSGSVHSSIGQQGYKMAISLALGITEMSSTPQVIPPFTFPGAFTITQDPTPRVRILSS
ncbi:hypothetical protein SKAU_G00309760 [Synaphobranchus kaupii]|uniref:Uncharacterized protein n=1 Tax=Synaphobranchus kaupii TaxID=118154 RepID=A0A9Q1IL49_SYNKA|nr:hypothetical protein SKAU_G00309760 [Synaphobranchus kaupii]